MFQGCIHGFLSIEKCKRVITIKIRMVVNLGEREEVIIGMGAWREFGLAGEQSLIF